MFLLLLLFVLLLLLMLLLFLFAGDLFVGSLTRGLDNCALARCYSVLQQDLVAILIHYYY